MRYARNEGMKVTWRFRFIVPPRQKSNVQVLQRGGECLKGPQKNNREQGQMAANRSRPLSPHLTIWRWGPHMLVSILHRMTGAGLATVGVVGLVWWLTAAAMGPEAYETFYACATGWLGKLIGIGLTWVFFQSEEHTSELQSLMRISYAVFCLKK